MKIDEKLQSPPQQKKCIFFTPTGKQQYRFHKKSETKKTTRKKS